MPPLRPAERALQLTSRQPFVCKSCRARQLHTSPRVLAEEPFLQRMRNQFFGSKEEKEKEKKRDEIQKGRLAKAAEEEGEMVMKTWTTKKGVTYQVAPVVDPKGRHEGYTPASTWDGLQHIGGKQYVKKARDQGEVYQGFMPARRVPLTDRQLANLIHHVAVEVLALKQAGRDAREVCSPRSLEHDVWKNSRLASINLDQNNTASLQFQSNSTEQSILDGIPQQGIPSPKQRAALQGNELGDLMEAHLQHYPEGTTPWMALSLRDPAIKLAISKRLLQLTGSKPSDFLLSSASTLEDLYTAFKTKPAPKKLAQAEELREVLPAIPNVSVHAKKRTMIHKEKAVGRWKVIEEELMKRDLPITGSRWPGAKPTVMAEWKRSV